MPSGILPGILILILPRIVLDFFFVIAPEVSTGFSSGIHSLIYPEVPLKIYSGISLGNLPVIFPWLA